ncbi:hypothetical protein RMCBS344292_08190 [Rhizopus microsporus]|nr:hypothetical protein RMCBS344292_08190 [Rhizopus microsporus]
MTVYRNVSALILRRLPLKANNGPGNGNLKDFTRMPDEVLYLVVKKPRKDHAWQFPQGGQDKGETPAEAALRELREECGEELSVRLIDTQDPIGTYKYKFPKEFIESHKRKSIGAQVSFFRADWISGQCQPDQKEIVDFAWLTKSELWDYVHSDYKQAICSFL